MTSTDMAFDKVHIYVAMPVTGHELTLQDRYSVAMQDLAEELRFRKLDCQYDVVSSIDIENARSAGSIGEAIDLMLACDYVFFADGYKLSRGCNALLAIARELGKPCMYSKDDRMQRRSIVCTSIGVFHVEQVPKEEFKSFSACSHCAFKGDFCEKAMNGFDCAWLLDLRHYIGKPVEAYDKQFRDI